MCECTEKSFFFDYETYTRKINLEFLEKDIVIDFIIVDLFKVCLMVLSLKREKVFQVN